VADDTHLSVICTADDARTFADMQARAREAGLTEYRTAPMIYHEWYKPNTPPIVVKEWWELLTAGDVVYPARDSVPVVFVSGLLWRRISLTTAAGARTQWDVYSVDVPGRRVCIYPDGRGIAGGLWVSPDDITKA